MVYKAYDDNTAELLDLNTYDRLELTEKQLVSISNNHKVIGLATCRGKVTYMEAYTCTQFPSEFEATEYSREHMLYPDQTFFINGLYCVLERTYQKIHVDYLVCYYTGNAVTYVGKNGGYTPYPQAAARFDKKTAGKKAAFMNQRSKTGKHWVTERVVVA
jgi:hypothetical protein